MIVEVKSTQKFIMKFGNTLLGREVTNGAFPWPQTALKQLEEWHVIVSCDQLGETLRAAPTLLIHEAEFWLLVAYLYHYLIFFGA